MSHPVVALQTYDTIAGALATSREHSVHHFPVCSHDKVVGMVCTCDFRDVSAETQIAEVMRPAVTIPAIRSSADAAQLMKAAFVGSILVVDWRGNPCGIVTRGDLIDDAPANQILSDSKCECCGSIQHLRGFNDRILCVSCRDRALEPQEFETGGGD
jgi:predicted transcriptional regulator